MPYQAPTPSIPGYLITSISQHRIEYLSVSVISLLQTGVNLAAPFFLIKALQEMQKEGTNNALPWLLAYSAALLVSKGLTALRTEIITPLGSELSNELGESVVNAYYALPMKRYISPANSSMVNYFGASIHRVTRTFIDGIHGEIIPALLEIVSASILISVKFGVVGAIVTGALLAQILLLTFTSSKVVASQNEYMKGLYGAMDDAINQVGQYTSVNIFNAASTELKRLALLLKNFSQSMGKSILIRSRIQFVSGLLYSLSILGVGLFSLYKNEKLSTDDFLWVVIYLSQLAPNFERLTKAVHDLLAEREFFKGAVEYIKGGYDTQSNPKPDLHIDTNTANIHFNNVTLRYEGAKLPAIQQLSFKVLPGEFVVITGESGAGKTSILNLLEKFYAPTDGEIIVAGSNISNISTSSVRDAFAIVPQETLLLNASIRANVSFANPKASLTQINQAIQFAGLSSVLHKYGDSPIGVGGGKLSGGQRQRVAIARAFIRNSYFLVLDEPTASLDAKTEKEIFTQLSTLASNKNLTTILITHHLTALKYLPHVSKIIVLHNGKIVEQGTQEELLRANGFFAKQMQIALAQDELASIKVSAPAEEDSVSADEVSETFSAGAHSINVDLGEGEGDPLLRKTPPQPPKKETCVLL